MTKSGDLQIETFEKTITQISSVEKKKIVGHGRLVEFADIEPSFHIIFKIH